MKRAAVVVMLGTLWCVTATAHQPDELVLPKSTGVSAKASGLSTVELRRYPNGFVVPHQRNVRFFTRDDYSERDSGHTIYREEIETEYLTGNLGEGWRDAQVTLTSTVVSPRGKSRRGFRIESFGQDGKSWDDFYVISAFGCCGRGDGHAVYSLETGRLIMYASGRRFQEAIVRVTEPHLRGEQARWVAVAASGTDFDGSAFKFEPVAIGEERTAMLLLTYASEKMPLMRVLVRTPDDRERRFPVRAVAVVPPGQSGEPLIRISLDRDRTIEIPVRADALDAAHARLPQGMSASLVPSSKR
jgi:hypothetical protein